MSKRTTLLITTGICLLFVVGWAMAQPPANPPQEPAPQSAGNVQNPPPPPSPPLPPGPPPKPENVFKQADKDGDGNLSLEEFKNLHLNRRPGAKPLPPNKMGPPNNQQKGKKGGGPPANAGQCMAGQPMQGAGNPPGKGAGKMQKGQAPGEGLRIKAEEIFKGADKNGDGKLTLDEFKTIRPPRPPQPPAPGQGGPKGKPSAEGPRPGGPWILDAMKEADKDGDKKVTLDELKAVRPRMNEERFKLMDANSDGFLTEEDIKAWPQVMQNKFKEFDTDKDGKLSRDEIKKMFPNMSDEAFKRKDLNQDGYLSLDELKLRPQKN